MSSYKIVAVLWEDHTVFRNAELPSDNSLNQAILPSLTIGLLFKETKKYLVLVSHIERYDDHDDSDYTVILRGSVMSMKDFGEIEVKKLRYHKEGRK